MADNDYIGQLQNSRWQTFNAGYLNRTPSWMQGDFKQGTSVSTARHQPARAGVSQYWAGGDIRDTRTKPGAAAEAVDKIGQGFVNRNLDRQAQAQQAQQQAQAGQQLASGWQNLPQQAQFAQMKQQYTNAFKPAPASPLPTSPLPPPAPGVQPFGTPAQNQAFPAPGTPAPARPPLTQQQQQAVAGVQQMKAARQPTPTTASKPSAKTRSQRRTMGTEAINRIRESLYEQNIPDFLK
jgi:hypothetical protein